MTPSELARRLRLYVLTDRSVARGRSLIDLVAAALEGGATAIQLREKSLSALDQIALGRELRRLTADAGALFIVNDRADIALALEADGVHLGQDDLPVATARKILGPGAIIGGSAGSLDELRRSIAAGVDYLGVGPMYATGTKADAGPPIGPAGLAQIRQQTDLPIVGIGAIDADNAGPVIAAGADGVAVISAVLGADDVAAAARRLRQAVEAALTAR